MFSNTIIFQSREWLGCFYDDYVKKKIFAKNIPILIFDFEEVFRLSRIGWELNEESFAKMNRKIVLLCLFNKFLSSLESIIQSGITRLVGFIYDEFDNRW